MKAPLTFALLLLPALLFGASRIYSSVTGSLKIKSPRQTSLFQTMDIFSGNLKTANAPFWTFSGDWWLNGKTITYLYKVSTAKAVPPGYVDHDEVLELTDKTLTVKSGNDGKIYKCIRVEDSDKKAEQGAAANRQPLRLSDRSPFAIAHRRFCCIEAGG